MATTANLARLYDQLVPTERLTLTIQALGRGEPAEAGRLIRTCPRREYKLADPAFMDRLDLAFDTFAVVCIDLRSMCAKLEVLNRIAESLDYLVGLHHLNAAMAFVDGERCGRGESQSPFYVRRTQPEDGGSLDPQETATEAQASAEEIVATPISDEPLRERLGHFGRGYAEGRCDEAFVSRIKAVDGVAADATSRARQILGNAAADIAQDLVDAWEAFGRFSTRRLGVSAQALLSAWGFPIAEDILSTLARYAGLKPREAEVAKLTASIEAAWVGRFEPSEGER